MILFVPMPQLDGDTVVEMSEDRLLYVMKGGSVPAFLATLQTFHALGHHVTVAMPGVGTDCGCDCGNHGDIRYPCDLYWHSGEPFIYAVDSDDPKRVHRTSIIDVVERKERSANG